MPEVLSCSLVLLSFIFHWEDLSYCISSFVFIHLDSGECPTASFGCLGGRCLPLSWRCNGQVECLGESGGRGTDEEGCDGVEATTASPKYDSALNGGSKFGSKESGHKAEDASPEWDDEADLLALLANKAETGEEARVTQTPVELAVTPAPIEWPCGGLLQTFYGTFSPPAIRGPALFCVWTLDPQDSRPLRLDLQQLVLGPGDRLTVYNQRPGEGDVLKVVSSWLAATINAVIQLKSFDFLSVPRGVL